MFYLIFFLLFSSNVVNTTNVEQLTIDTQIGLSILELTHVKVTIVETPNHQTTRNYVTKVNDEYFIFLDTDDRYRRVLTALAHELIHIQQYESNLLIDKGNGLVMWNGREYHLSATPHENRPWEVQANNRHNSLRRDIMRTRN